MARTIKQQLSQLALAVGMVVMAGNVMAQQSASASANSQAVVVKPIAISKSTDLNFGRLASVAGTVSIAEDDGERTSTATGSVVATATGANAPSRAAFAVTGEPNLTYSISAPAATIILAKGSDELTVTLTGVHRLSENETAAAATATTGTLSAQGTDTLGIGGSLILTGETPSGTYSNSGGISLTVAYN